MANSLDCTSPLLMVLAEQKEICVCVLVLVTWSVTITLSCVFRVVVVVSKHIDVQVAVQCVSVLGAAG